MSSDPRTIRLARTMLLDAMLLGAALAIDGDKEMILDSLKPSDMTSESGRLIFESIKDGERKRFAKIMARRYGVVIKKGERALPAILRSVQLRNSSEALRSMTKHILEYLNHDDQLGDVAEAWEEGLAHLKRVVEIEKSLASSQGQGS